MRSWSGTPKRLSAATKTQILGTADSRLGGSQRNPLGAATQAASKVIVTVCKELEWVGLRDSG